MKTKHIAMFGVTILLACALTSLVTYRMALRRLGPLHSALPSEGHPASGGCVDLKDAGAHVGETGCVSGRLLRVFTSRGGNTFLDFCQDYRACPFTSVIFARDKEKFGDLQSLNGRQVEIHGNITTYQGRAEIIVRDPEQIRVAE